MSETVHVPRHSVATVPVGWTGRERIRLGGDTDSAGTAPGTQKRPQRRALRPFVTRGKGVGLRYLSWSSPEGDGFDELWSSECPHDGAGLDAAGAA
jgi:hypothetical protein